MGHLSWEIFREQGSSRGSKTRRSLLTSFIKFRCEKLYVVVVQMYQ